MNNVYSILADIVLCTHVAIVLFVILGLVLTLAGKVRGWRWVRNPWFRYAHLLCIGMVVAQAWAGIVCPLTTLEMWLREQAGEATYAGSFITYWLSKILYYDLAPWVFTLVYSVFGGLVLLSWFWVRPRALVFSQRKKRVDVKDFKF